MLPLVSPHRKITSFAQLMRSYAKYFSHAFSSWHFSFTSPTPLSSYPSAYRFAMPRLWFDTSILWKYIQAELKGKRIERIFICRKHFAALEMCWMRSIAPWLFTLSWVRAFATFNRIESKKAWEILGIYKCHTCHSVNTGKTVFCIDSMGLICLPMHCHIFGIRIPYVWLLAYSQLAQISITFILFWSRAICNSCRTKWNAVLLLYTTLAICSW